MALFHADLEDYDVFDHISRREAEREAAEDDEYESRRDL